MTHVLIVPPSMHNNRHILQSVFEWVDDNVSFPPGTPKTKTFARAILRDRLDAHPHLHHNVGQWNSTVYRIAFSAWQELFHGLLIEAHLPVPFMATIISFILNSPKALPTPKRCVTLALYAFLLPRMMGWTTSSLYWHSVLHLIPVLLKLGVPACLISEEHFESAFRPVKHVLRGRSNNKVGNDLLAIRAFGEAKSAIRKEWCSAEGITDHIWDASVSLDVVIGPCLMADSVFLVNLPGLLQIVTSLDPALNASTTVEGQTCLRINCGDIHDCLIACTCGQHVNSVVGACTSGFIVDGNKVESARSDLCEEFTAASSGLSTEGKEECGSSDSANQYRDGSGQNCSSQSSVLQLSGTPIKRCWGR